MKNVILICLVGGLVGLAAAYYLNQPEPTPSERFEDAMQDVGEAMDEAGDAIADGIQEAQENLQTELQSAADEFSKLASESLDNVSQSADELVAAWNEAEIVTDDEINFDNAIQAVNDSSLDELTKNKIVKLLEQIRDTPSLAEEKISEIRKFLETSN